jgi:hypothetical protein
VGLAEPIQPVSEQNATMTLPNVIIIATSRRAGYQHTTEEDVSIERTWLSVFVLHRPKKLI